MSNVWFTADTHFGHGDIIKYCNRPFLAEIDKEALERDGAWHDGDWKGPNSSKWRMSHEAVEMMDNTIIQGINAKVGAEDTLWHLGDFAFAPRDEYYRRCRYYRDRIVCQHVNIVWGNHDRRDQIRDLFERAFDLVTVEVEGQRARIVLCHYALLTWDGSHRGNWNLYGHSHGSIEGWADANLLDRKSQDVGVDNACKILGEFRPFGLDDLRPRLMGKLGHSLDHHVPRGVSRPREEDLA